MILDSVQYLLFLALSVLIYCSTPAGIRWATLVMPNCVFYMLWRPEIALVLQVYRLNRPPASVYPLDRGSGLELLRRVAS